MKLARRRPPSVNGLVVDDIQQSQLVYCQELFGMSGSEVSFFLCVCVSVCAQARQIPCVKYRQLARKKSSYAPEAADECPNDLHPIQSSNHSIILDSRQNRPVEPKPFLRALSRPFIFVWRWTSKVPGLNPVKTTSDDVCHMTSAV